MTNVINFNEPKLKEICSFCKLPKSEKRKLIIGDGTPMICYSCLTKCNELIKKAEGENDTH